MSETSKGVVVLMVAATLLLGTAYGFRSVARQKAAPANSEPLSLPAPPPISAQMIDQVLPRDSIQAIDDPRFEAAATATGQLWPEERVVGLVINGEARAYPIPILSVHEIVNDVVGGEPVAITWCPLCYTALVFSRTVPGHDTPLTFGVSGKLLHNTLVMYDRQTESLWSQLYGGAVGGPLSGRSLAVYPAEHTTWKAWRARHPQTEVLSKRLTCAQFNCGTYADNPRGSYDTDPYLSYYQMPDEGVIDAQIPRESASSGPKPRVLGVRRGTVARAYTFAGLRRDPLRNDSLAGAPILVWFAAENESGAAFSRQVAGQTLTFRQDPATPGMLVDEETNSRWQAGDGRAISGPLAGTQLRELVTTPAFAFGWEAYFPRAEITD